MSSINIVFQEKGKGNLIMKGKSNMPFSELIQTYYKKICASKKEKMTKLFVIKGTEHSPEESTTLSELGLRDYSEIEIQSTEKAVTAPREDQKKQEQPQEQPQEEVHEEQPQEEQPQEEQPQEEQPQENNDEW